LFFILVTILLNFGVAMGSGVWTAASLFVIPKHRENIEEESWRWWRLVNK
jgi:hypothetical protein